MRRYIVERDMPDPGGVDTRAAFTRRSARACAALGPGIEWVETYLAGSKCFCVFLAADEDVIREHARRSGLPVARITEVPRIIDPTTAGG